MHWESRKRGRRGLGDECGVETGGRSSSRANPGDGQGGPTLSPSSRIPPCSLLEDVCCQGLRCTSMPSMRPSNLPPPPHDVRERRHVPLASSGRQELPRSRHTPPGTLSAPQAVDSTALEADPSGRIALGERWRVGDPRRGEARADRGTRTTTSHRLHPPSSVTDLSRAPLFAVRGQPPHPRRARRCQVRGC